MKKRNFFSLSPCRVQQIINERKTPFLKVDSSGKESALRGGGSTTSFHYPGVNDKCDTTKDELFGEETTFCFCSENECNGAASVQGYALLVATLAALACRQ